MRGSRDGIKHGKGPGEEESGEEGEEEEEGEETVAAWLPFWW